MEPLSELGGSRTHNRLIRSQGLYPIELLVQSFLTLQKYSFFRLCKQKNEKIFVFFINALIIKMIKFDMEGMFLCFLVLAIAFLLFLHHRKPTFQHHEIIIDQQFDQLWRELFGLGHDPNRTVLLAEPY